MIQIGSGAKWLHRSPEHSGHSDEELTDDHVVGVRDVAQPSRLSAVCMELNRASLIVLVAEDETLIAMGMEDALRRAGYTVGGVFATSTSALGWLENYRADAAVLDFCLRDRHCVQLLRELRARGTPIIIYSATKLPDEFNDVSRVMKPAPFEQVVDAVDRLVLRSERMGVALPAMQMKQPWPTR